MNYDMLKLAVEGLSGGKNTIVLDDRGMPSFMVRVPKFKVSDVITGATEDIHPAFIVDGVEKDEILISKYQNIVKNDRAYSLPLMDPATGMNFDAAKKYCENKGKGFHLMTNAERAAIALWSKKNETMPRGNNNYGSDHSAPHERGIETYATVGKTNRVATGSGPASWAHDGTTNGIYDLKGNVREWVGGFRLLDGEIQIIANNNAANHVNQTGESTLWKAITADGSLVEPGIAGTLKYDGTSTPKIVTDITKVGTSTSPFENIGLEELLTAPQILKSLALYPGGKEDHGGDTIYTNNEGERVPNFGGNWASTATAGVFYLFLYISRTSASSSVGFRSAYIL